MVEVMKRKSFVQVSFDKTSQCAFETTFRDENISIFHLNNLACNGNSESFKCKKSSRCVPVAYKCDGDKDCSTTEEEDDFDEENCPEKEITLRSILKRK